MLGIMSGLLEKGWVTGNLGWCAGRNPPSVQRQHSAKRATRASRRHLTGAYSPFHPAGQPFHRSPHNRTQRSERTRHRQRLNGRFVSALEPSFSAHALSGRCSVCVVDGVSSMPSRRHRKPPASSPTNKRLRRRFHIRVLEKATSSLSLSSVRGRRC